MIRLVVADIRLVRVHKLTAVGRRTTRYFLIVFDFRKCSASRGVSALPPRDANSGTSVLTFDKTDRRGPLRSGRRFAPDWVKVAVLSSISLLPRPSPQVSFVRSFIRRGMSDRVGGRTRICILYIHTPMRSCVSVSPRRRYGYNLRAASSTTANLHRHQK